MSPLEDQGLAAGGGGRRHNTQGTERGPWEMAVGEQCGGTHMQREPGGRGQQCQEIQGVERTLDLAGKKSSRAPHPHSGRSLLPLHISAYRRLQKKLCSEPVIPGPQGASCVQSAGPVKTRIYPHSF